MSRKSKKNYKNKRTRNLIISIFALLSASSLYLIYNILLLSGIENFIRIGIIAVIISIVIGCLIASIKAVMGGKPKTIMSVVIVAILVGILEFLGASYINRAYTSISKMNKVEANYSTSLIAMSDSNIDSISDLKNKKIGIIKDTKNIEGYIISQEIISENKINKDSLVQYDDFLSMLNDLYESKIDALFISSGYTSTFSSIDHFSDIKNETKVIISKEKRMAKQDNSNNTSTKITEPFTMLVMGIDSTTEDITKSTSFNGDTLILITFNPKTLNTTMMSIPRDTFVPIMCFKNHIQNKITHAAWYGESCMIDTIENFTGINIDYYAKINFKGVVKLVDSLNGVEVDVPYSFCEQNSNREWGKNTIFVNKGIQTLNGEQALALARNRHTNAGMCSAKWTKGTRSDIVRGQNQQLIIKAIANKLKEIRDINKVYEILDLIEKSMDTNLTTNQILSFYNIGKNILARSSTSGDVLNFQKLYLSTYGAMIYDEGMGLPLSDQIYYKGSLKEVVDAMQINLGIKEPTIIKDFSFSINELYEEKIIGKGTYNEAAIALVPDFTKKTKQYAINWGDNNNIPITFNTVESSDYRYIDGQITNQSIHALSLVSNVSKTRGITLTIIKKITKPSTTDKIDCTSDENEDNSLCIIPDFRGKKLSDVTAWQNKLTSGSVTIIKKDTETDVEADDNKITYQTENYIGKNLYALGNPTITIEYYNYVEPTQGDPDDYITPGGNGN